MKINKIYLYHLRNASHLQFHNDFKKLINREGAEKLGIVPQFANWQRLHKKEQIALQKIAKSALTEEIQETNKARDNIYIGMVNTNTAALRHFNETIREAARVLKILFDTYGNITRQPLNDQSSAFYHILQELKGDYAPHVKSVGIDGWVLELEALNKAFNDLMSERYDEYAEKTKITVKNARIALDKAYISICECINVFVLIKGLSNYEKFVKTLNVIIAKYHFPGRYKNDKTEKIDEKDAIIEEK